MFLKFFQTLKNYGIPVTIKEYLDMLKGLDKGICRNNNVKEFYFFSRLSLVKDEKYYDRFDKAFKSFYEYNKDFISEIKKKIKDVKFNGLCDDNNKSTYTLVNVMLPIKRETGGLFMFKLDMKGIACSKGSACQSGSDSGSHVLREIQNNEDNQKVSLRFSFSIFNTKDEVDYVINQIDSLVN